MYTEARKRARNKYNREHLRAVSTRIQADKMELFNQACQILGTNKNAVLQAAVNQAIEAAGLSDQV